MNEEEITKTVIDSALTLAGVSRQAACMPRAWVISDHDPHRLRAADAVTITAGIVTSIRWSRSATWACLRWTFSRPENADGHPGPRKLVEETTGKNRGRSNPARRRGDLRDAQPGRRTSAYSRWNRKACARLASSVRPRVIGGHHRPGRAVSSRPDEFIPLYADRKSGKGGRRVRPSAARTDPEVRPTASWSTRNRSCKPRKFLPGTRSAMRMCSPRDGEKKKPEEMAKQRAIFVEGRREEKQHQGREGQSAFDVLDKVAGYGSTRRTRRATAVLAYQTAWLKAPTPGAVHGGASVQRARQHRQESHKFVAEAKAMASPAFRRA